MANTKAYTILAISLFLVAFSLIVIGLGPLAPLRFNPGTVEILASASPIRRHGIYGTATQFLTDGARPGGVILLYPPPGAVAKPFRATIAEAQAEDFIITIEPLPAWDGSLNYRLLRK